MNRKVLNHLLSISFFLFISIKIFPAIKGTENYMFSVPFLIVQDSVETIDNELRTIDSLIGLKEGYGLALEKSLQLYSFSELSGHEKFKTAFTIGLIYNKTNNYDRSLRYYKEALKIFNQYRVTDSDFENSEFEKKEFVRTLLRIGGSFQLLGQNDSAKYYYKKIEDFPSLNGEIESIKAIAFSNMSGAYEIDSIYDKAEYYARKSIAIHSKRGERNYQASALNNLGNLFLSQKMYKKSKDIYLQGINLVQNDNSEEGVRNKATLYYNLAWAMRNLKEYKAYDALEDSYEIKDELRSKEIQQIVETVTRKHNVDIVKKESEIKAAKASKKSWLIIISSISVIFFLLFIIVSFKLRQRSLNDKLKSKEAEKERELNILKSESQALILNAALDGKESERKEIAETLHDNVSTLLSSANLHLQACKTQFNGNTPVEVDKTQIIINEASQKIRDLSHTLVSSILLKFGLSFALNDMIKKYSNSQIKIQGKLQTLPRYNQKFEIKVYNIIQELINNVLKHSKATEAFITLSEKNDCLFVTIKDNGKGFDKTKISVKDGMGINQIDARIQMMKGKFEIHSKINKGTLVEIELPIYHLEKTKNV